MLVSYVDWCFESFVSIDEGDVAEACKDSICASEARHPRAATFLHCRERSRDAEDPVQQSETF